MVKIQATLLDWQNSVKDDKDIIINASDKNGDDDMVNWMIGMSYKYLETRERTIDVSKFQVGDHNKLVMCSIHPETDTRRRGNSYVNRITILKTLEKKNIINEYLNDDDYFLNLPNYKFVISPEGNGIDCHRHYEAIMAGCIPIVEDCEYIRIKYNNLPVLYTKDYSEITEEYLLEKYNELIKQEFDFSMMFLSSYDEETRYKIVSCSRYWTIKLLGELWKGYHNYPISTYRILSDNTSSFSLAIPTMNRYDDYLKKSIPEYLKNKYINEIVICDENGEDYQKIKDNFSKDIESGKIKLFKNESRLGVMKNKIKVMSLCSSEYVALIDSDNFADEKYFEEVIKFGTNQLTILLPSYSLYRGNFTSLQYYNPINKSNWYNIIQSKSFFPRLNDGNGIYPRLFIDALSKFNLMFEPYASDAFIQTQLAVSLGFDICFTNSSYIHHISENSEWIKTEDKSLHFLNNWNFGLLNLKYI
jgi:hypothetical protein